MSGSTAALILLAGWAASVTLPWLRPLQVTVPPVAVSLDRVGESFTCSCDCPSSLPRLRLLALLYVALVIPAALAGFAVGRCCQPRRGAATSARFRGTSALK